MTKKKGGHPGVEKEYALDFLAPIRYVADALERSGGLSSAELYGGYNHHLGGDLERVKRYEGLASNKDANTFLVERALLALGEQVEENGDGKWHLTRPFNKLRYNRKGLHLIVDLHAQLRDPFNPMSGRFSENIRRSSGRDTMDELRESMRDFGWVPEFPALVDERGVVLVGHRRLAVATELGIEPVKKVLKLGTGDEADAKRFRLALVSNLGFKEMTPEERKDIAEYLYGVREWVQARIALALNVDVSTISRDLREFCTVQNPKRGGRPRKLTPELEEKIVEGHFEEGKTRNEVAQEAGLSHGLADLAIAKEKARREMKDAMESPPEPALVPQVVEAPVAVVVNLCVCPNCGHEFAPTGERA